MNVLRRKLRRDIRGQWPQFTAISLTVLLGIALFTASYDAYRNLDASYQQMFEETDFADLWVTGGDVAGIADRFRGRDGVAAVATRIEQDLPLRIGGTELRGRVISLPEGTQPPVNGVVVLDGALPDGPGEMALEQHAATHYDLAPGANLSAFGSDGWRTFEVAANVASAEYLWQARSRFEILTPPGDFAVVWVAREVAAELVAHSENQVVVRLDPDDDRDLLGDLERFAEQQGATQVLTRAEQPSNSVLQEDIDAFSQMSIAFPLLFLTAAGMASYVLLTRRVRSERQLIGTLRASGVSRGVILRHYLGFAVVASMVGAVLGIALGVAVGGWLTGFYTSFIDLPLTVIELRAETIGGALLFALVVGSVAALAPARAAAATPPAEAMRGIVPATGGGRTLLERLLPSLARAPASWRLVLRNITRDRRRTLSTMIGTVLALLLVLSSLGLLSSVDTLMARQFGEVQREHARLELADDMDTTIERLRATEGVAAAEPFTELPVALRHGGETFGTAVRVFPTDTQMHGFRTPRGSLRSLPSEGILVGDAATETLGVAVGDEITIAGPGLGAPVSTTVAGIVDEPLGTYAYASFAALETAVGSPVPIDAALLRFADDADEDAIRARVTELDAVVAYESTQAIQRLVRDFMGLFYGLVGGMVVLGAIMGFAIIFTTMSVNVIERSRDVATLRASGVGPRTIGRLITSENLIVTLVAIVPGVILGILGGRAMMATFSNEQFTLEFVVTPWTVIIPVVTLLVVALISQWPSLRLVRRLDIADVVRERQS